MSLKINRRTLLTALPASSVALALPAPARADDHSAVVDVIHELEGCQGWEATSVAATKGYAAYRLRSALGMDQLDPELAQLHLDYQGQAYEDWTRTAWFEGDHAKGIIMTPPPMALV